MGSSLAFFLKKTLRKKTAIIGVGNSFKKDDGVGIYLISQLKKQGAQGKFYLLDAGNVPENYLEKIRKTGARVIIFVDAVDFSAAGRKNKPGDVMIFKAEELSNFSLSTHNASLALVMDYLRQEESDKEIILLGIQPKTIDFGEGLSKEVQSAADRLAAELTRLRACLSARQEIPRL